MNVAYKFDIRVWDNRGDMGFGHTGVVFADTKESAEKEISKNYCGRNGKIISLELEETSHGVYETWNYSFDKEDI